MMKWIRWQGLVAFFVVVAVLMALWFLFVDGLVESVIEKMGMSIVGAEVDVKADVKLFPLGVTLQELQVTNPDAPETNSFECSRIASPSNSMICVFMSSVALSWCLACTVSPASIVAHRRERRMNRAVKQMTVCSFLHKPPQRRPCSTDSYSCTRRAAMASSDRLPTAARPWVRRQGDSAICSLAARSSGVRSAQVAALDAGNDLGHVADIHRHDGQVAGHGLFDDRRRAFVVGGQHQHVAGVHVGGHDVVRLAGGDDELPRSGRRPDRRVDGGLHHVEALFRAHAGAEEHELGVRAAGPGGGGQRACGLGLEKLQVDAAGDDAGLRPCPSPGAQRSDVTMTRSTSGASALHSVPCQP